MDISSYKLILNNSTKNFISYWEKI